MKMGDLGRRLRMVFTGAAVIISQLIHLNIEVFKMGERVPGTVPVSIDMLGSPLERRECQGVTQSWRVSQRSRHWGLE